MANPGNDDSKEQKKQQQEERKGTAAGSPGFDKKLDGPNRPSI
ncbi:hypothetical protein [Paenibacillus albicereus]|nr:hypothetical protein [Paenibacillus albicereus]